MADGLSEKNTASLADKGVGRPLPLLTSRWAVPAILLLGAALRIFDLPGKDIWLDEAYSLKFAQLNLHEIFFLDQDTPPLYYGILHWWIPVFGTSEWALRLPSALFGTASIFAIYKVGRRLFDEEAGVLSALLLAVSVLHVRYAQEARTYTLTVFLTLLSMYFFLGLLKKIGLKNSIGYVICSTLLIYSHVYGLFIILAQNIYFVGNLFLSRRATARSLSRWIALQALLVVLFSPWISNLLERTLEVQESFWIPQSHLRDVYSSFIAYASGSRWLLLLYILLSSFALVSLQGAGGGAARNDASAPSGGQRWRLHLAGADKVAFLLVWLAVPIVVPFIISQVMQPIYVTRYTIVASLALLILVARGISSIPKPPIKLATIGVIVVLTLVQLDGYYVTSRKEQWRDATRYVDSHSRQGDVVLFNATDAMLPFNYYSLSGQLTKKGVSKVDEKGIEAFLESLTGAERVWLILSHAGKNQALITKGLSQSFAVSSHEVYYDIEVYLFSRVRP